MNPQPGNRVGLRNDEMTGTSLGLQDEMMAKALVREYIDNGLDVYDATRKRLGTVSDYDRPGGGFVVRLSQAGRSLFIPLQFVKKVRQGRVYLSELAHDLIRRPPP